MSLNGSKSWQEKKKLEADKKIIEKINKLKEKNETLKKEVKVKHAEVKSMKHHMEVYQGEYEKLQTHNGFLRKTVEEKDKEIRDLKAYIDTMSIGLMAKQPDLLEALERAKSPPQKTKTYDSSNITNGYRSPPVFRSPPAVHFSDTPSYSKPPSVDSIPPPPPPMGPPPFPKMNVHSQPSKMAPMPNMTEIYDESSFSSSRKKSDGNANGSSFYDQSAAQKFWERVKSPDYYGPVFSR